MAQSDVQLEANTVEVSKQTADRLGRVVTIFPACLSIHESTHLSGTFNTFETAGLPPPDNAASPATGGAGNLTGAYAYYVTHYDSNRDSESNPSAQSSTVNPSSEQVDIDLTTITNEAANSRITHFRIYRNLNGGSVYYFVAEVTVATTSYTDDSTDATIQANDTLLLDNDAPAVETYGACLEQKGYMFLYGAHSPATSQYEDDFTWSKVNNADQYPLLNRTKIEPGRYGRLVAAANVGDTLLFYKERAIYQLTFNQDPSGIYGDGFGKTVNTQRGALNKRCVANAMGTHFVMDRLGIYVTTGGTAFREIGSKLKHYWARINWAEKEWFTGVVDVDKVVFFVALDGDEECKYAFVLDLGAYWARSEANWYVYKFDLGIRDACPWMLGTQAGAVDNGMQNTPIVAILTEYGYTGYLGGGYRDMVDPQLTAQGTTTSTGTTTTFVQSTATWQRTNDAGHTVNVVGSYVRFINPGADKPGSADWSQAYRITGYSGTGPTLTFTPAAPANVPSGTVYVIGAIPDAVMHSPVYGFDNPHRSKRIGNVVVEHEPGGTEHVVNMKVSLDRRATYLTRFTRDVSQLSSTDRLHGLDMKLGGAAEDGGRVGVQVEPPPGRSFKYMQIVLSGNIYGGHAIDNPAVIDALVIDGLDELDERGP